MAVQNVAVFFNGRKLWRCLWWNFQPSTKEGWMRKCLCYIPQRLRLYSVRDAVLVDLWFPSSRVCQNFEFWNAKAIWYFLANCCNFTQDVALRVSDYYYKKCIRYQVRLVSPLFIFIPRFFIRGNNRLFLILHKNM